LGNLPLVLIPEKAGDQTSLKSGFRRKDDLRAPQKYPKHPINRWLFFIRFLGGHQSLSSSETTEERNPSARRTFVLPKYDSHAAQRAYFCRFAPVEDEESQVFLDTRGALFDNQIGSAA
jgi:hypothetical protein